MANILIVGGAGYIGGWLTDRAQAAGHDVRVYDLLLYEELFLKDVDFTCGDIRDTARLRPHLDWADVVIWLAALVGDGACALDPLLTSRINLESVEWLARTFKRRIVFMSTCSVYGAQDGLLTEESPCNPLSLYAKTKLEAERALGDADAVMFRLGTIYGLSDRHARIRMDLVLNTLTIKACLYGRMSVFGGEQYRPLLHVRDVAEGVLPTMTSSLRGVFNLHSENVTIRELAERVRKFAPQAVVEYTEMKFQDSRNYRVSSDKAKAAFGFAPKYTVDDGIRQIANLVSEGRVRDISSPRYSNMDFLRPMLVPERTPLGAEIVMPPRFAKLRG